MGSKRPKSIWDMIKNQAPKPVKCPACDKEIMKSELNDHLDFDCLSSGFKAKGPVKSKAQEETEFKRSLIESENTKTTPEIGPPICGKKVSKLSLKSPTLSAGKEFKCSYDSILEDFRGTEDNRETVVASTMTNGAIESTPPPTGVLAEPSLSSTTVSSVFTDTALSSASDSDVFKAPNVHSTGTLDVLIEPTPTFDIFVDPIKGPTAAALCVLTESSVDSITTAHVLTQFSEVDKADNSNSIKHFKPDALTDVSSSDQVLKKSRLSRKTKKTSVIKGQDDSNLREQNSKVGSQSKVSNHKKSSKNSIPLENSKASDVLPEKVAKLGENLETSIQNNSHSDLTVMNGTHELQEADLINKKIIIKEVKNLRPSRWTPDIFSTKRKYPKSGETSKSSHEGISSLEDSDVLTVLDNNMIGEHKDRLISQQSSASLIIPDIVPVQSKNDSGAAAQYSPYYIANFKKIVDTVLEDEHNNHLFNSDDMKVVDTFNSLSDAAQKLYVRLFQRKYKWLRTNKIVYPQISSDLSDYLEELVLVDLLDSDSEHMELETALGLLSLNEIRDLSKQFNFNPSGKSKVELSQLLIKHAKQHKSFFSVQANSSISSAILKKVKQIMGSCYKLALEPKRVFTRILMLFSLPTMSEDDEEAAGGQQQQLLTLLQINKGELTFPNYKVNRQFVIFKNRDELISFEIARQLENDILNAVEAKKFESGKELYMKAKEEYTKLCSSNCMEKDLAVPFFLRRYTASHVYVRCLNQGIEILQKLRLYEEAVTQLRELLDQTVYGQDRRGKWYERIALNLEQHLKRPQEAGNAIKEGLRDGYVRVGPRYMLLLRAERIVKSKKCEDYELNGFLQEMSTVIEAPKVTVKGRLLPRPIPGRRHIFISSSTSPSSPDDITVLNVEQLVLEHYKTEGYMEGIHGEGSTFISLYALLFWDIIYDSSIPDAFISPYQTHPLDLNSDDFFEKRCSQINSQLETLRNASEEELKEIVRSTWSAHNGNASLVNWESFTDAEHVVGLVLCLGSSILAGICERVAKDFRFTRSGVPDLVVWNPDTKKVKIAEVKGPGDKLSAKQILWLDYLIKLGADAEVCLVEAVGSKKLRKQ